MNIKRGLATLAIAALSLTSLAACGSDTAQDEEKPDSLSFWYYEEDDAGQTQAWRRAAKAFEKETGVKINFERKSFTQIAQNGSQFLNSDEAPDLMESNRGNGSAGVLSTMGLLTDLGGTHRTRAEATRIRCGSGVRRNNIDFPAITGRQSGRTESQGNIISYG